MTENIVVTGGSGMIGSNLVNRLVRDGQNVYNIDNLSGGSFNSLTDNNFIYCDVSNRQKLFDVLDYICPSIIFHCAAHFANQNSVDYPLSDINDNLNALINILDYAKMHNVKVIFTSSSCVYGNNLEIMSVDSELKPYDTPYAINKFAGELYCKYYNNTFGVQLNIVRIFNTYGPGELPGKYRNVIPNFFKLALSADDLVITGTGSERRDFTFVDDTIELLMKASHSNYWNADVFNAGTGQSTEISNLAKKIKNLTQSSSKIVYTDRRKWDHVPVRVSDITHSKKCLDYSPSISLDEGLRRTHLWLQTRLG